MNERKSPRVIDLIQELGGVEPTQQVEVWATDRDGEYGRCKVGAVFQLTWPMAKELGKYWPALQEGESLPVVILLEE